MHWFSRHTYLALFLGTWIEGLGIPLPAEVLYAWTGVGIKSGRLDFWLVSLTGTAGNILGSMFAYGVAYLGGKSAVRRLAAMGGVAEGAAERAQSFFRKYGSLAVTFCRFVGVIRAITIFSAGLTRMSPARFALFLAIGALGWNLLWSFVGLVFGHSLPMIMHRVGRLAVLLVGVLVLFFAMRALWHWWRRRTA